MEFIRLSSEEEVVACFLKAELSSSRFRERIDRQIASQDPRLEWLENPNIDSEEQNEFRAGVLNGTRGWKNEGPLFDDFPLDVIWHKVKLNRQDLQLTRYLSEEGWIERTANLLDPLTYVQEAAVDDPVILLANKYNLDGIQPLIFLTTSAFEKLSCVEGNVRLTALALSNKKEFTAIIGVSDQAARWKYF